MLNKIYIMKKIVSFLLIVVFSNCAFSQIIIGDNLGTAPDKTSVLLEFALQNKGIILPYVKTLPSAPTEGTIVLDASDATKARVKYYNGGWVDLSGQDANVTVAMADQPNNVTERAGANAIIGAATTSSDGVLVLESKTKAMVLPTVADVNDVPSPSPGMMVYVNKVGAKRLAVFNGSKWSFWKPQN